MQAKTVNSGLALHVLKDMTEAEKGRLCQRVEADLTDFLPRAQAICDAVAQQGDAALLRYARELDKADITGRIAATPEEFRAARASLPSEVLESLEFAADNIRRFHAASKPAECVTMEIQPGVFASERHTPVDSAAIYVPRGKGSFPSTALMTAIPASVAGVGNLVMLTPPGPDGQVDAATLAAAEIAGVERVYKVGGAVAVAAAAYGTETVPRCGIFEGPGSPWTIAAKQILSGKITSRVSAGPSEAIILGDDTTQAHLAALDLLIEAEHGADSSVFFITWSPQLAEEVATCLPQFWARMSKQRVAFSSAVLSGPRGGIVLAQNPDEAYAFINDYAPEHLQILSDAPYDHLPRIRNASEILLGPHTPSSIANYTLGPNAVLPTAGFAKFGSGLTVRDFMKSCSVGHVTQSGYDLMARHTMTLAQYEGFDAHANAVSSLRNGALAEAQDVTRPKPATVS